MKIFDYEFQNEALLRTALTTPSYRNEHGKAKLEDNQRLEFLGDAVLGLLAADSLYAEHPQAREGTLTATRSRMVSSAALCRAAERHGIAAMLKRNRGAAPLPSNSKTIADAVEALIGAAWLEGGLDAARTVFRALELEADAVDEVTANPKGELQILAQAMTPSQHPAYEILNVAGKAHEPRFTVRVSVPGWGEATATAGSRHEAEAKAAAELLSRCAAAADAEVSR